jgi:hypothetical protein
MRKIFATLLTAVLLFSFTIACQPAKDKAEQTESVDSTALEQTTTMAYVCPMHPEEMNAEPGTCSKCGMDLVKKDADDDMHHDPNHEH